MKYINKIGVMMMAAGVLVATSCSDFNDYNGVLAKFVRFLTETDIIHDYIVDCGECEQDMGLEFKQVQTHSAIFDLGDTAEEEVRNVYAILKYIVDHNLDVSFGVGMSYSTGPKYQDILNIVMRPH